MEKPSAGRAFLGFFITVLMVLLMMADGLLIGLKTTVLKGTDIVDILKNADAFGMMSELISSELDSMMGDEPMMEEAVATLLSEEVMAGVAKDMTEAIVNGEEVDLTRITDDCLQAIENTSNEVIDQVFDEVASDGEINVETLMQSELLKSYEQQFGMSIAPMVEEYVSSTYGDTTIKVDEEALEAIKSETKDVLNNEVMSELEEAVKVYIEDVNVSVNQEIQAMNETYDIAGVLRMIENAIKLVQMAIIVTSIIIVLLILIEIFLVYKNAMNRGVRNIGVSAIFAGLAMGIVGAVMSIANSFLLSVVGISGMGQDRLLQIVMNFIEGNFQKVGIGFLMIAVIYMVVAIVCLIFSSAMKKSEKSWN